MRWRASYFGDANRDHATESRGIRHQCPYVDGHTNCYAGAANASGTDANCHAYAHANAPSDGETDRDTSARVA